MLAACQDPDLVTEITLQPVRRHGVDAAILFSDIVLPLVVAGVDIEIKPGVGPVVASPVRTVADVDALPSLEPDRLAFLTTAVGALVAELGATPLIGFAGAPFTLATYLIEGGPSKEHARTKAFMYAEPRGLAPAARPPRRSAPAIFLHAQIGRRRLRGPAVRLLGRGAVGGRLRRAGAAALARGVRRRSATPTCRASTSGWAPGSCCR